MRLESHKVRKVAKSNFRKKVRSKKMRSLGFWKNVFHLYVPLYLNMKVLLVSKLFAKTAFLRKR